MLPTNEFATFQRGCGFHKEVLSIKNGFHGPIHGEGSQFRSYVTNKDFKA